jgi:hypothetical protein
VQQYTNILSLTQEIDIGGGDKYKRLRDGFIMATVNAAADRKSASVMGYLVQNQRI